MRKRDLCVLSLVVAATSLLVGPTGCSSNGNVVADNVDDQGDDVDAVTPNEQLQLSTDEVEDETETPAQYAAAEPVERGDFATDMMPLTEEAIEDVNDAGDEVDGLPGSGEDGAFPIEGMPEAVQAAVGSKIKYVLVIVKENHTFDNYFTGFPHASWAKKAKIKPNEIACRPIAPDGALGTPCHSNCCGEHAYANGDMDGFHNPQLKCGGKDTHTGLYPFIRFTEEQIPNYWKLAREYVLADHFFSTTLGPSSPGHEVFWFSQSTSIDNAFDTSKGASGFGCDAINKAILAMNPLTCTTQKVKPCFDLPALPDHLPNGYSWMDYGGPMASQIKSVVQKKNWKNHFRKTKSLLTDLTNGDIANLTVAHVSGGKFSEHPPEDPCQGENFTVDVINAAMALPQWNEMAIIVTWDDWGGFYDHVKPTVHQCKNGKEFENGFRLPMILISPYARKGFVLKDHVEQASVPKLVEELWHMDFMHKKNKHARDAVAGSLLPAFDFSQAPRKRITLKRRDTCPDDTGAPPTLHLPAMVNGKCD